MKRVYQFYDKEALDARPVCFGYPVPFYSNMEEALLQEYGSFLALIDHDRRIVRLHSPYDSGKCMTIIPLPTPLSPLSQRLATALTSAHNLILIDAGVVCFALYRGQHSYRLFKQATVDLTRRQVSGYVVREYGNSTPIPALCQKIISQLSVRHQGKVNIRTQQL